MFLKFPPINGESKESGEKGGTEDINIGIGELQEGKPKAIVIVGSKVRALSQEHINEIKNVAPKSAAEVKTEADLALFAAATAADDRPTEEVAFYYGKIVVKYEAQGKLFGFLSHAFTETVTLDMDADGLARVKVKLPWYSFVLSPAVSVKEMETETTQADEGHKKWIEILSVGVGASIETQAAAHAQAFTSLSNVLKTKHDTAKNSIGNIR